MLLRNQALEFFLGARNSEYLKGKLNSQTHARISTLQGGRAPESPAMQFLQIKVVEVAKRVTAGGKRRLPAYDRLSRGSVKI